MALIPAFFADCVVAIGTADSAGEMDWIASGFFYGQFLEAHDDEKKSYRVYLVSNRHVLKGLSRVYVRCNPQTNEPARIYDMALQDQDGEPLWYGHPDEQVDVAIVPVNIGLLKEQGMQVAYFTSDSHVAGIDKLLELGITEGDFAYVLGFPMRLLGGERNAVMVRSGSIARIRDALAKVNNEFLVDAFVFPGNSGGPVVSKPEILAIEGTKSQRAAYLIGVVKSYVPYQDVAVSAQTGQPRVIFEENSGLAAVHPVDFIEEAIQEHLKAKQVSQEPAVPQSESGRVPDWLERIRRQHPRAYEKWTEDEEARLMAESDRGRSIPELAEMFQRQQGAIRSRLQRLGRVP